MTDIDKGQGKDLDAAADGETAETRDDNIRHHIDRRERFAELSRSALEKQVFRKAEFGVRKAPPGRLARLRRLLRR